MDLKALTERMMNILLSVLPQVQSISGKIKDNGEWGYYHNQHVNELATLLRNLKVDSILDIGCGAGLLLAQLNAILPAIRTRGIDNEPALTNIALQLCVDVRTQDAMELSKTDIQEFRALYLWAPYYHYKPGYDLLTHLSTILSPDQYIIIYIFSEVSFTKALTEHPDFSAYLVNNEHYHVYKRKV